MLRCILASLTPPADRRWALNIKLRVRLEKKVPWSAGELKKWVLGRPKRPIQQRTR
jgi:hypothetical protein